ncbi:hypothetical protein C8R47DRAFT_746931 [Mycena vitilis]|nr:hypothetical protein C8R47DRAFT_746931 [Mycena vitilis]
MHPSLGLHNLRDLPQALYAGARRAANGSLEDLKPLVDLVVKEGSLNQGPLVPVFYVNLNPAPDIRDLASILNARGLMALRGLHAIRPRVPKEADPEVWPRFWKWVSFLHAYRDAIPNAPVELEICGDFLIYVGDLVTYSAHLVASNPRARVLIVHSWRLTLDEPGRQTPTNLAFVGKILTKVKIADPPSLAEFIEGAGGTLEAAATLITRSLDHFFPTMHTEAGVESSKWLEGVFYPLHELMVMREARDAMVEAGLTTSLIKILYAFSTVKFGSLLSRMINIDRILHAALLVLQQIFKSFPQEWVLREAVDSGLLRAVVACGFREAQPVDVTTSFLTNTLTRCTLYYPILLQMAGSLQDLQDYTRHPAFVKCSIFSTWTSFQTLVETRATLARPRRSQEYISGRSCNNIQCGEIRVKTELFRCGGCQVVYYCSPECQKQDWTSGGHRTHCNSIRAFFFRNIQSLTPQHISFFRALVHADYMADKHDIMCRQLACYRSHPSALVVTVFDYATGHARIDAHPASALMKKFSDVNWREHLPRAVQSAGLMELHLAVLPNSARAWVFPLRSNSPVLQDGLRRIAASTTALADSAAEVRVLMESTRRSLVQIHQ